MTALMCRLYQVFCNLGTSSQRFMHFSMLIENMGASAIMIEPYKYIVLNIELITFTFDEQINVAERRRSHKSNFCFYVLTSGCGSQ